MAERQPPLPVVACWAPLDWRLWMQDDICGEGVAFHSAAGTELKVTPSVSGMTVAIAAGGAFVAGSYGVSGEPGMYHVWNDATAQLQLDTADALLPRIDTIVARVNDPDYVTSGDLFILDKITGTPNAAAALTTAGIAASAVVLSDVSYVPLAYVLVTAGQLSSEVFVPGDILDQRSRFERCSGEPYVLLEAAAATSVTTSGTEKKVDLATTSHLDPEYFSVSASVVTVKKAGTYKISAYGAYGVTGTQLDFSIWKNGIGGTKLVSNSASGNGLPSFKCTPFIDKVELAANETILLATTQNVASPQVTLHGANNIARLCVSKVG